VRTWRKGGVHPEVHHLQELEEADNPQDLGVSNISASGPVSGLGARFQLIPLNSQKAE
jgi:hypothetical protein